MLPEVSMPGAVVPSPAEFPLSMTTSPHGILMFPAVSLIFPGDTGAVRYTLQLAAPLTE
jgi:hypothetical protein